MLTTFQKVKETLLLTIINVVLPTVDIFTDLISITKLYIGSLTYTDCDEKNELEQFGFPSFLSSRELDFWSDARSKCIENSSAEGLDYDRHPIWATSLLVPFLINYLTTWFIWWSIDKRKTVTWIAPLLSVYPQVRTQYSNSRVHTFF